MRWLIRTITRKAKGTIAHSDESVNADSLTLGRSPGQNVFLSDLRVALEHARVHSLKGGRFRVESLISAGVRVDGKLQQAAGAGLGSRIEIGTHLIRMIKPPAGYDAAIEISESDSANEPNVSKFSDRPFSLGKTWLSKRGPAWLLFLLTLGIGLGVPVAGHFLPGLQEKLRSSPLPSDGQWEAGTLQAAHHFFGEDCSTCHVKAFQMVEDQACVSCHSTTAAHADPEFFALPELAEERCASCHKDHNGLDGLVRQDQRLCADCHTDLDRTSGGLTVLGNASDFTNNHPQFRVELAAWGADGEFMPRRESLSSDLLSEDSNLKFPHDIHLADDGINAPSGKRVLACADCHEAEPGGGKMLPVAYETMCQDCHTLGFDAQAPDRQVPHGKVPEVLFMLEEYYANRALQGGYDDVTAPAVVRQRRRVGSIQRLSQSERAAALAWARSKSRRVGEDLFEGQACSVCHRVTRSGEGDNLAWNVRPVRVAGEWFPKAQFTHGSHTTMTCESCHDAKQSGFSDDVLIPGIDNCQTCHGGEDNRRKVASTCVSCHNYHIFDGVIMASGTAASVEE